MGDNDRMTRSFPRAMVGAVRRPIRLHGAFVAALALLLLSAPQALGRSAPDSALRAGAVDRTSTRLSATYDVKATLSYDARTIGVTTDLSVTNTSGDAIDHLVLNLLPAVLGGMTLDEATVAGRAATVARSGQNLTVPLGGVLANGATVSVRIGYHATFRTTTSGSDWLWTKRNGIIDAYRWIPWISRATPFTRPNFGDPFVTPVSPHVTVTFTTDRVLRFASTGFRTSSSASGLTQVFQASNVRDFNFTAAPDYRTSTGYVGDTRVIVYYRSGTASAMLSAARAAISRFESLVGPYPYPNLLIGQSGGGYGMESPGHIWIPYATTSPIGYLVTHETAHQWFYAAVGNDQASEPYADEAMAEFLTRYTLGMRRASRCSAARLDLTIYDYSQACYYETIYIQGGDYLDDLRLRVGSTAFWSGVRDYYARYRFALAGTKQLLATIDAHTSQDLAPSYHTRFPRYY